ncbi:hypothetical protein Poli38472_010044 [Pythium oligandrum]|uniref:Uncharacterized protein n=1 Tax=Pythium oligandrum TaxID=41045 RepID=A0A8K1FCM8_PYTOL|nr:hypothetical protein Poli38472_010044 [Pythium oligandrum]|eukprot:TMW58485.1 hypothetical protein Poli38472_010044 [Pythium oligandrum]
MAQSFPTTAAAAAAVPASMEAGFVISEDALLLLNDGHSIYENTRMSGEQVRRHELPINAFAEASDRSNDADDDALYARSLLSLLSSPSSSRL